MRLALAPSYLRGRLAQRLLAVFVLASVVPVLLASLIAYQQLLGAAHAARTRDLHRQVETASLAFLAQLQVASAQLAIVQPGQARSAQRARSEGLRHLKFRPLLNETQRARAFAGLAPPVRRALAQGRTAISWGRDAAGRPALYMTRVQPGGVRLARAQLNVPALLARAGGPDGSATLALVDVTHPTLSIGSANSRLPPAVMASMAHVVPAVGVRAARRSARGRWLGSDWELFLPASFAAPPVRLILAERAGMANGLAGLRWMIPLALLGSMAFAVLLAIRQLRRYLGPLETLTMATRRLTEQKDHTHVRIDTGDELQMLGDDFNRMAEQLLRRARFDSLTGLANREFFHQSLGARLACAERTSTALLYVDLDAFKKINDSAGHEAGDAVLVEVVSRLRECVGPGSLLARLGGDEFAVVLAAGASAAAADALAERILRALQPPVIVHGFERRISASIGIAIAPEHGEDVEQLLRSADIALYEAKDAGRDGFARFNVGMHQRRQRQILLEAQLQGAIAREELVLFYQPITCGERLIGVEALVRWERTPGELVSPTAFISIAEQSNLITAIGEWVLRRACADFARWQAAGIAPQYLSVNVAPKQLVSSEFFTTLCTALERSGMPAERLHIEITESAVAREREMEDRLRRISALGLCLVLDDFGTGYSSLSHLHRLPFEVIKIDRSFIVGLPDSPVALQLVRTILSMGHGLGKTVVAEGVETEAQRALLQRLGCDELQGYLMGRPMSELQMRARLLAEPAPAEARVAAR